MITPADVKFHPAFRLLTWHPRGVLDNDAASKIVAFIEEVEQGPNEPLDRFVDLSGLAAIELNFESIVRISMHRRRAYSGREPVNSVFLATTPEALRLARLHATLTEGTSLRVTVFTELAAAAEWLGVPAAILAEE